MAEREQKKEGREVFLTTAADEREYDVYKSLLTAYGIPVFKKQREAGGYLSISMGMNVYGVDIYVPEKDYETALELIESGGISKDSSDKETDVEKEKYDQKRLTYIWIIIAMFYVPVLVWLIYTLIKNLLSSP